MTQLVKGIVIAPQWVMRERGLEMMETQEGEILEIGCNTGNFAKVIQAKGLANRYLGVDIQGSKIKEARRTYPGMMFLVEDITSKKPEISALLAKAKVFFAYEVLEHIEKDIEVLTRLTPGTEIIISVPNFTSAGHLRSPKLRKWLARYQAILNVKEIVIFQNPKHSTKKCYLIHGERK